MSNLPEFLYPVCFNLNEDENKRYKPEPKTGLSEFLHNRLSYTRALQAVASPKTLAEQLNKCEQEGILWLDLELDPKIKVGELPKLLEGAFVVGDYYWRFNTDQFGQYIVDIIRLIKDASFLGGHNLIEFDLPHLYQLCIHAIEQTSHNDLLNYLTQSNTLSHWQLKAWDTLMLSCVLIPHQPSHALAKLYKANMSYNDPVQDCLESREVFQLCQQAWQILPANWQLLLYKLLPQLGQLSQRAKRAELPEYFAIDVDNIFDSDALFDDLPKGNQLKLKQLLKTRFTHSETQIWQNLGLATFMSWLRYYDKPQARRPVWITKHLFYQQGFHQAEQAYWQLNEVSEAWINEQVKHFFGFDSLRDGQMQIVKAILNNQDIPLGILPTGGGKSLAFQLPALILSHYQRQLTVVISPLKALIEDQVINLRGKLPDYESRIAYLTSGQTPEVQQEIMTGIWQGDIDIIYLSPERLKTHSIRKLFQNRPPAFWVLDEAHTLSQWGTDFRPDFLRIAEHIKACYTHLPFAGKTQASKDTQASLGLFAKTDKNLTEQSDTHSSRYHDSITRIHPPRICLMTATASPRVKSDLQTEFTHKLTELTHDKPLVQYGIDTDKLKIWREDITVHFIQIIKDHRKSKTLEILQQRIAWYAKTHPNQVNKGVAIVYLRRRKDCEQYAEDFAKQGIKAVAYHAKLDESQKKSILNKFKNDELEVVVCTNAFGMGIDKAGIHTVIHSGPPNNIESYVQEIGRAARKDNEVGEAYMLWSEEDIQMMFSHERNSRIANNDTLKNCWQAISPTLKKTLDEQWFPSSTLSPILDVNFDNEQLNTQIRVALLALERYGLLEERDQQPAWVSIHLLNNPPTNPHSSLAKLYAQLRQIAGPINPHSSDASQEHETNRYHLPELALALGYSVKNLLKMLRELVKNNHAQWQVVVRLRTKYTHRHLTIEFNRLERIVSVLKDSLNDAYSLGFNDSKVREELEKQGYTYLNTKALDHWLSQNQHNLNSKHHILPLFRHLGIIKTRSQNAMQVMVSATTTTKDWLRDHELPDGWTSWLVMVSEKLDALKPLFIDKILPLMPDKKDGDSQAFNLDALATELGRTPDVILHQLETLQQLELIELSRLDDDKDTIFFIGQSRKADKKTIYNEVAYRFLKHHYEDRCQRIHVLHAWLLAEEKVRETMVEDYFKKPLNDIIATYITANKKFAEVDVNKPYLRDYSKVALPDFFSPVQRQIVTDTSRASMVLAGPGSGKTTVVVHRVAYLLMIESIKPEKILILAYNRLAVVELRQRLQALVGQHCIGVTIQTFHGLARQIIGMSEKEAPTSMLLDIINRTPHLKTNYKKVWGDKEKQKVLDDARYLWLIEEANRHLQERPQHFQYIMVDEFQDIDASQYKMIGLLADLQPIDADDDNTTDTNNFQQVDKFDQRSHLMVVGDDDQNLYAFRGASIEFIQQFTKNYHIDKQQEFYLLANYRSASNIVELANKFIETAIPLHKRLKSLENRVHATDAYPNQPIRYGVYQQPQGVDMAAWLASDIQQRLRKLHQQNTDKPNAHTQTIAILAPKWEYFNAIQHYLEALGIISQRYHEEEQVSPINSFIGQALYSYLTDNRLQRIDENVVSYLEKWRKDNKLNHLDMAWAAICERLQGINAVTHEDLLPIIESVTYQPMAEVILITYHSAKGMEFDHVYVIDEQTIHDYQYTNEQQDKHRPLYVALTRAKRTLTLLQHQKHHHPNLASLAKKYCQNISIPQVDVPNLLTFHRFLHLDEMVLTPKSLVSEEGRTFINEIFCRNLWSESRTPQSIDGLFKPFKYNRSTNKLDGFYSNKDTLLVQFARTFNEQFTQQDYDAGHLRMVGFTTTLFYQTDISYYEKADYRGNATSHYLIVPCVRFGMHVV